MLTLLIFAIGLLQSHAAPPIRNYQATLTEYIQKMKNLTQHVEIIELGGISYTELEFELLKLEIRAMESLVIKLQESINGSSTLMELLYAEINNISVMVNQLASHDKNHVLAVRRKIASLSKKLQEHKKNQRVPMPSPVNYGTCNHGGLKNISKPFVIQLNWLGSSYRFGGWGKDSFVGAGQDVHWVAPLTTDARTMNIVRLYPTNDDLLLYKRPTDKVLTKNVDYNNIDYSGSGQGGGMILFNNSMYYNCYNTRDICKYNVDTGELERKTLTDATLNSRFSSASTVWQDIDLASDEDGLWAIYSTEHNDGNITISKINSTTLTVEKTWFTAQYKPAVTNAFMVCGVLYATRTLSKWKEEIFYMYDTKTSKEGQIGMVLDKMVENVQSVNHSHNSRKLFMFDTRESNEGQISMVLDKMMENVQSVNYNPNDHKLYMYNDGYLVTYDISFKPRENITKHLS